MSAGVLYISYDGMLEPLGQSQVLAYLERLATEHPIHLISFEKPADWKDRDRRQAVKDRIDAARIHWHPLRYHKSPTALATAYDIAIGSSRAIAIARRQRLSIVHARSYVAGVMALAVKRLISARFLFDMRGFWADERVDGGLWPAGGRLYRAAKTVERRLLLAADHVVALTSASAGELCSFNYLCGRTPPISVIPTCADLDRFTIRGPLQHNPFVLGYVGSVGTWYLLDEMLRAFQLLQQVRPDARFLMVNRSDHSLISERLQRLGIDEAAVDLVAADHREMPAQIARMTAGLALYRPSYSRLACAPTKLAEYLGCGVPCLGSRDVGDMTEVLEERRIGVTVSSFSDEELRAALERLVGLTEDPAIQQRCRQTAIELFSLDCGVASYASIYRQLAVRNL